MNEGQKNWLRSLVCFQKAKVKEAENLLGFLYHICGIEGHDIQPRNPNILEELKTDMWACTGAVCSVCGQSFGWWCPNSPDHLCHYSKSDDDCDYCHMPSERK